MNIIVMTQIRNLPKGELCIDQLYRMNRWYIRFRKINEGQPIGVQHANSFEGEYDEVLTFFMNCYHLKDWIKNDICDEHLNEIVEEFINKNDCLKLCADICNGAKHLDLNHTRFGENTHIRTEVHIDWSRENPSVKKKWSITTDSGQTFDAFDIATQCIVKWVEFFNAHERELNVNAHLGRPFSDD